MEVRAQCGSPRQDPHETPALLSRDDWQQAEVTIQHTLDRSRLWSVQTPQTFRVDVIRRALAEVRHRGLIFTDDTAACELIGQPVRLISSAAPNPKVTVPGDLPFVESLLRARS